MSGNSRKRILSSRSFWATSADVFIELQEVVYSDSQVFYRGFWLESDTILNIKAFLLNLFARYYHELEFGRNGFHTIYSEPINSIFTINLKVCEYTVLVRWWLHKWIIIGIIIKFAVLNEQE